MGAGHDGDDFRLQRMAILWAAVRHRRDGSGFRSRRAVLPDAVVSRHVPRPHYVLAVPGVGLRRPDWRAVFRPDSGPPGGRTGHARLALVVPAGRLAMRAAGSGG